MDTRRTTFAKHFSFANVVEDAVSNSSRSPSQTEVKPPVTSGRQSLWKRKSIFAMSRRQLAQRRQNEGQLEEKEEDGNKPRAPTPITLSKQHQQAIMNEYLKSDGLTRDHLPEVLRSLQLTIPITMEDTIDQYFVDSQGRPELIMQPDQLMRLIQKLLDPHQSNKDALANEAFAALQEASGQSNSQSPAQSPRTTSISEEIIINVLGNTYPQATLDRMVDEVATVATASDLAKILNINGGDGNKVVEAFKRLGARNPDGLGFVLDTDTLRTRCEALGLSSNDAELIVNLLDRDASGEVDLREFQKALLEERKSTNAAPHSKGRKRRNSAASKLLMVLAVGDDTSSTEQTRAVLDTAAKGKLGKSDSFSYGLMNQGIASYGSSSSMLVGENSTTTNIKKSLASSMFGPIFFEDEEDEDKEEDDHELSQFLRDHPAAELDDGNQVLPRYMHKQQRNENSEEAKAIRRRVQRRKRREEIKKAHREGRTVVQRDADDVRIPHVPSLPLAKLMRGHSVPQVTSVHSTATTPQRSAVSTPRHRVRIPQPPRSEKAMCSEDATDPEFNKLCNDALDHFEVQSKIVDEWTPVREDHRPEFTCTTPRFSQQALRMPVASTPSEGDADSKDGNNSSRGFDPKKLHNISRNTYSKDAIRTSVIANGPLHTEEGQCLASPERRSRLIMHPNDDNVRPTSSVCSGSSTKRAAPQPTARRKTGKPSGSNDDTVPSSEPGVLHPTPKKHKSVTVTWKSLQVNVLRCAGLEDQDWVGTNDAFVTIHYPGEGGNVEEPDTKGLLLRTKTIDGTKNPTWDDAVGSVDVEKVCADENLVLNVWDEDVHSVDHIGRSSVPVPKLPPVPSTAKDGDVVALPDEAVKVPLKNKDGVESGTCTIKWDGVATVKVEWTAPVDDVAQTDSTDQTIADEGKNSIPTAEEPDVPMKPVKPSGKQRRANTARHNETANGKLRQIISDESGQRYNHLLQRVIEPLVRIPSKQTALHEADKWEKYQRERQQERRRWQEQTAKLSREGIAKSKRRFKSDQIDTDRQSIASTRAEERRAERARAMRKFLAALDKEEE